VNSARDSESSPGAATTHSPDILHSSVIQPEYACAILRDARGWLILQLRPPGAAVAPSLLTCFGGRREAGEDAHACLRRELGEELGWCPPEAAPAPAPECALWRGARLIAHFYRLDHPRALGCAQHAFRVERGHVAVAAPWPALPGLPLSPWHRAVLTAVAAGTVRVEV
jgi:8-oxo-dGTP pyrophosphatase MutT (NUDIX family)